MGYYKQKQIEEQEIGLETIEDNHNGYDFYEKSIKEDYKMALTLKNTINASIIYPEPGKIYDVITNQGNVHKNITFKGYSNGIAKPNYIFIRKDNERISINPSYQVEMCEIFEPLEVV